MNEKWKWGSEKEVNETTVVKIMERKRVNEGKTDGNEKGRMRKRKKVKLQERKLIKGRKMKIK